MSNHAATPPGLRPRYGRIAALGASVLTTVVALLAAIGVLPSAADPGQGDQAARLAESTTTAPPATPASVTDEPFLPTASDGVTTGDDTADTDAQDTDVTPVEQYPVPAKSGKGRRAVFDQSDQRVWMITQGGTVLRTYLVSGSKTDNLKPGTYEVFSRSEDAIGVDGTTMHLFVRFTYGRKDAIGFHTIPTDPENNDEPVQTKAQLGTPLSHGCIRQKTLDAKAMWRFAELGTKVVVVA